MNFRYKFIIFALGIVTLSILPDYTFAKNCDPDWKFENGKCRKTLIEAPAATCDPDWKFENGKCRKTLVQPLDRSGCKRGYQLEAGNCTYKMEGAPNAPCKSGYQLEAGKCTYKMEGDPT